MYNKYKDSEEACSLVNADVITFRPTFVIDEEYDEPYCEDEFQEMRVGNIMFRQVGPCQRCKTTSLNWKLNIRHPNMEPYATICQARKHHKLGPIFGVYFQPDIIETKDDFEKLFPDYPMVQDRSFGKPGIIKQGDALRIRVRKRTYYLS